MSVHLLVGSDESILGAAVSDLVRRLVGDGDRALMVDEFDDDADTVDAIVDAAQTPSFLTDRRVVVARNVWRFRTDEVEPLLRYVADPLPTTDLVLVGGGGTSTRKLVDALKKAGATVTDTSPPSRAKEREGWIAEQAHVAGVRLDAAATQLLVKWIGEDTSRVAGLLETLHSAHGSDRVLRTADVEPFLGERGGVPPWDLTDAVDRGDVGAALGVLQRMMHGGERHPLAVLAILHGHYSRLLALDGVDASPAQAMSILGVKSEFAAQKAVAAQRRLGSSGVGRAIELLAAADLDLKGGRDWPAETVAEVLVARLARLARR